MIVERELDLASSMLGPLTEDSRARLLAVVENPTRDNWEDAHRIILRGDGPMLTLWQAVIAVDPTFPRRGTLTDQHGKVIEDWHTIPDRETLRQAIAYATH